MWDILKHALSTFVDILSVNENLFEYSNYIFSHIFFLYFPRGVFLLAFGNDAAEVIRDSKILEDEFGAKDKFSKLEQMVQELLTENLEMKKKEKRFADSFAKLYAALQVKYMYGYGSIQNMHFLIFTLLSAHHFCECFFMWRQENKL